MMDPELRALWPGSRDEQRRMADDPGPCERSTIETCPFGRVWCSSDANLSSDGGVPCLSCWLRRDRDDGGPHPTVASVADTKGRDERTEG